MRENKFIPWFPDIKKMGAPFTIDELANGGWYDHPKDWVLRQFTGLKDKNGKEIYEGDIVQICMDDDYDHLEDKLSEYADCGWKKIVVEYDIDRAGYAFDADELFGGEYIYPVVSDGYVTEVIGNIYENPELLS